MSGVTSNIAGVISRRTKSGSTSDAFYFVACNVVGGSIDQTSSTGTAYYLIVPGRSNSNTAPNGTYNTSSDPMDTPLNTVMANQSGALTPTVTVTPGTYTYTGSSQGPLAADVNKGGSTGTLTLSYSGTGGTTYGPSSTPPTNAGSYTVTASVAASGIYTAASSSATAFTIAKRALTVTANNDTKTFGSTKTYGAGSTAFTSSGLQNSETIGSVTIAASGGTAAGDAAGTYTLTPSAATGGTFNASNYTISYVGGTLTVGTATPPSR